MENRSLLAVAAAAIMLTGIGFGVGWMWSQRAPDESRLLAAESAALTAKAEAAALATEVERLRAQIESQPSRAALQEAPTAALSAEVARLREQIEQRPSREAQQDAPPPVPAPPPSVDAELAERISELEKAVAALAARSAGGTGSPAAGLALRRRQTLERLVSISDRDKRRTIRSLSDELVACGDDVVPDILEALNSGVEHEFYSGHSFGMSAGILTSWGGRRMVLLNILRQIETPAADEAFLEAVANSRRLSDYRDLLIMYLMTENPVMVRGISALVPDMLREVAEAGGVQAAEREATHLAWRLAGFITWHDLSEVAGPLEDLLRKAPAVPGGGLHHENEPFFAALARFEPERAARIALDRQEQDPERLAIAALSRWLDGVPYASQILYFEVLFSQPDVDATARRSLFNSMWLVTGARFEDAAKQIEDTQAFVSYLEGKRRQETDANVRRAIEHKLADLRRMLDAFEKRRQ